METHDPAAHQILNQSDYGHCSLHEDRPERISQSDSGALVAGRQAGLLSSA